MSFVFYDTETTGTNTSFDQILQFGAIKTDYELNEIERFEIRCRILPGVVPSPGAMLVTGVTAGQLNDPKLPSHYQMMCEIKGKLLEWSPAIFIGHNSIGFDERLLRQAFYKTLHPPYLTNTNGNCRTDSLRMLQATNYFSPKTFNVPLNEQGKQTFKLDQLAPVNGFAHEDAHDAMADVEATIHMCRLIADRAPDCWSNFLRFSQKSAVVDFVQDAEIFSLSEIYFGKLYSWLVTDIGANPDYAAERFAFDLSVDPEDLAVMSDENLKSRLSGKPKPIRRFRANAGPIIFSYDDIPSHVLVKAPSYEVIKSRADYIKENEWFRDRLISMITESKEESVGSVHVEEQIYDSFASNSDLALMSNFHESEWNERMSILEEIVDPRFEYLGKQLLYTEAVHVLSKEERSQREIDIARRILGMDGNSPWLTLSQAIEEIELMLSDAKASDRELLNGHYKYLQQRLDWANSVLQKTNT